MPFMKPYMVKLLREQFPPGTRIRLDSMMNDPQPVSYTHLTLPTKATV